MKGGSYYEKNNYFNSFPAYNLSKQQCFCQQYF